MYRIRVVNLLSSTRDTKGWSEGGMTSKNSRTSLFNSYMANHPHGEIEIKFRSNSLQFWKRISKRKIRISLNRTNFIHTKSLSTTTDKSNRSFSRKSMHYSLRQPHFPQASKLSRLQSRLHSEKNSEKHQLPIAHPSRIAELLLTRLWQALEETEPK